MTSYSQWIKKLYDLNFAKKSRMAIEEIQMLHDAMDLKPFLKVHVAGTNGKGSLVRKVSEALILSGKKCATFTSPHISTIRERIQINNRCISPEDMVRYLPEIFDLAHSCLLEITFFEVMTLLALKYFSEQSVDLAIIEVGLGGRLDATNCISPELTVITSISLDHTQLLGETLEEIAFEKAGIIKQEVPLITGPTACQQSIKKMIQEKKAPHFPVSIQCTSYDQENQEIAKAALHFLQTKFPIVKSDIDQAVQAKPSARYEKICHNGKELILDMSHNQAGLLRLFEQIKEEYPGKEIFVFTSMTWSHDYLANLRIISQYTSNITVLDVNHPRLAAVKDLLNELPPKTLSMSIDQALEIVEQNCSDAVYLFTGSIFIMEPLYIKLGLHLETDDPQIYDGVFNKSVSGR